MDVRLTQSVVEILYKGKRVASHCRSDQRNQYTTVNEHMPKAHQKYLEWTPERLIKWAAKSGEAVVAVVENVLASRKHVQQSFRACLGIMRLEKEYGHERLSAACTRALEIGSPSYKTIKSMLKSGMDRLKLQERPEDPIAPIAHPNVRGAQYYNSDKEDKHVNSPYH